MKIGNSYVLQNRHNKVFCTIGLLLEHIVNGDLYYLVQNLETCFVHSIQKTHFWDTYTIDKEYDYTNLESGIFDLSSMD